MLYGMAELILPELSYKVVGALFKVYNELGGGYQEKYYQRAVAKALRDAELQFQEQVTVPLLFGSEKIGRYFIDFVIKNEIALEIKATPRFYVRDTKQVLTYLKATGLMLGLLAAFGHNGLQLKRILRGRK